VGEDKVQKSLVKALNRYEKQEEVRKSPSLLENDLGTGSQLAVEQVEQLSKTCQTLN